MRRKLFRFQWINDKNERSLGFAWKFFGLDICFLAMGYLNDWRLIDLRIPSGHRSAFLQLFNLVLAVGVMGDDSIYQRAE